MSAVKQALAVMEEAAQAERAYLYNPVIDRSPFAGLCETCVSRIRYDAARMSQIAIDRCLASTRFRSAAELRQIAATMEVAVATLREEAEKMEAGRG